MAIPKENRQQMINMMYLVLTALLALNVSAEIINAFKTINKSLENSKKSADVNLQSTFNAFDAKKAKEPGNASIGKYLDLANQSKSTFEGLLGYISKLKGEVVQQAGGADPEDPNGILMRKDDMDVSTRYLVEGENGKGNGEGYNLKKQIDQTLASVMNLVDATDKDQVKSLISLTTNPAKAGGDWVKEQFYQMPAIASYAMLTKLENDVKNTQGTLTGYFFSKIGRAQELTNDQIVFDKFSASLSSPSSYILQGETFQADVSLAATSSKAAGTVTVNVNGQNVPVDANGVAHYKSTPGVGEHPITGSISVKNDRTGQVTSYKLPDYKLTVAAPFATVSPTKMNVFYIGVDNPVEVSAAGTAAKDLSVSMSNGTITGGGGKYTVRVSNPGEANVNVSGKGKPFGSFKFRVKPIPDPAPKLSARKSGPFPAGEFKAQQGPYAELENFDFDARFNITSFSLFYQPKGGDPAQMSTSGTVFSAPMKALIAKAKPGDIYYIEDIKAVGPDGRSRPLPALAFKIR